MSISEIEVGELKQLLAGGAMLFDVREVDEYVSGHIPTAVNVPLSTITTAFERFRQDGIVYLVCKSGGRSMQACQFLADNDIATAVNVAGGTVAWQASGGELNSGDKP